MAVESANVQFRTTPGKRREIHSTAKKLGYKSIKSYILALHKSAREEGKADAS